MILVFGGSGQLGRELRRAATSRAVSLQALSRAETDIADEASIAAALGRWRPQLVVNAAAYTKVDLAESKLDEARRSNELGPSMLAAACARSAIPMVHVSTDYVFDGRKAGPYRESDPVCPISVYGRTKAAGEEAVRRALKHHLIVRTAWLYSEFGHNFLRTILRLAHTRDELRIVDDQHGSPTSAPELAEAILGAISVFMRDRTLAGTYHFTAAGTTTWHGFASRIVEVAAPLTGRNPRLIPIATAEYPTAAKRPANSRLACRLFVKKFGFKPRHWTVGVDAVTRVVVASAAKIENEMGDSPKTANHVA